MADLNEDEIDELREVFDHYDGDGNGVIDRDEFAKLMKTLAPDFSDDEIETGLEVLDENRNGVIEWDEFLKWWSGR
ncbi:MAG TPA: EF-hand domain-containing protein [Polyangiaceae bacterium LLY-WYZ-15_(1-7)]|nr:calcium sensor EFh [Myxococcales bacterium]MAT29498.1 calcium sensor EFh [Sandaracinus sp.]HJK94458.1 EF-hand domain-containing protein [Polyangiaceae bacterium LLY-WYZ-15_(1-7)]HJL00437.1 EF-hand domain-containing protein [Polyangiaceae bacterium LLY-WYZ-15_(1-7)]HJL07078.1 EF-hand domain-containing protein [Polyangiaceae bacterium LLY-WYZ-15_(1-7)]